MIFSLLEPGNPEWYGKLITRCILDMTPKVKELINEIVIPTDDLLKNVILQHTENVTEEEIHLWIDCLWGQTHFFVMSRSLILKNFNRKEYDGEFLEKIAFYIAKNSIRSLGLPTPQKKNL